MTNKPSWQKEFDKWFNHGTKKEPRFAYASGVYPEVKAFIQDLLNRKAREIEELKQYDVSSAITWSEGLIKPDEIDELIEETHNQALNQAISILKE